MKFIILTCALLGVASAQFRATNFRSSAGSFNTGAYKPTGQFAKAATPFRAAPSRQAVPAFKVYTPAVIPKYVAPTQRQQPYYKPKDVHGQGEGHWAILRNENENRIDGYNYAYETENRIAAQERGQLYEIGAESPALRADGFYEYVGDDGQKYRVDYVANENGFQPVGAHLPVAPEIPELIKRSLAYQARVLGNRA